MYGITIPYESPRSDESKLKIAQIAAKVIVKEFKPNEAKAKEIASQVDKEQNNQSDDEEEPLVAEEKEPVAVSEFKQIDTTKLSKKISTREDLEEAFSNTVQNDQMPQLKVEEFEKDEDTNYHIDFIYAAANVRALNYTLTEMDWITVKLKAGRIVPALATTTAAIAGL